MEGGTGGMFLSTERLPEEHARKFERLRKNLEGEFTSQDGKVIEVESWSKPFLAFYDVRVDDRNLISEADKDPTLMPALFEPMVPPGDVNGYMISDLDKRIQHVHYMGEEGRIQVLDIVAVQFYTILSEKWK